MKRIYLDQNKWIDLMRAKHGQSSGARFEDALTVASGAVEFGLASFPLSITHYMEVAHRRNWQSRHRLAGTMAELSQFHAIAPQEHIVPAEVERALNARFGRPLKPRTLQVFGVGIRHAWGKEDLRVPLPQELSQAERLRYERALSTWYELEMLRGPAADTPLPWLDTTAHRHVASNYQKNEEALTSRLRQEGWGKGDKLRRVMLASALLDILDLVNDALEEARVSADALIELGEDGLTDFLSNLPSRWVLYEMRRDLHARGDHEESDLNDLAALSIAVAYCDVVVTEKQWVHVIQRARVDEMMGTTVISDLAQLPELLV